MPPIAIAAASPTARVSVATAMITNIRKKVSTSSQTNDWPCEPEGSGRAHLGDVPERGTQQCGREDRAGDLGGPVADGAPPREVSREREGEGDGRVEVGAGDVADRVDHRHDHEPEGDRDADVAEGAGLGVDHDRAGAGEDECEGADRFGDERAAELGQLKTRLAPVVHPSTARSDSIVSGTTRK